MFSKYPIIKHKENPTEQQNGLMYIDIAVGKDTLRVIGVHLYSMSLRLIKTGKSERNVWDQKGDERDVIPNEKRFYRQDF